MSLLSLLCFFLGAWEFHGEAGANLPSEPSAHGPRIGSGASSLLQGGADPEHGPGGQGDHYGGTADLQASQETGLHIYGCGLNLVVRLALLPV